MSNDGDIQNGTDYDTFTDLVKARILDRIVADLRADLLVGNRPNGYTKSDSGIYGKYQKADIDDQKLLGIIEVELQRLLNEQPK